MKGNVFRTTDDRGVVLDHWIVAVEDRSEALDRVKEKAQGESVQHVLALDENVMEQWVEALKTFDNIDLRSGSIIKVNAWVGA